MARPANLYDLVPRRGVRWERGPEGRVTLLVPKFRNRLAVRWVVPLLAHPDVAVRLDEEGTLVWDRCDGGTTVLGIAEQLHRERGGDLESWVDRVGRFVARLAHGNLVTMELPGEKR